MVNQRDNYKHMKKKDLIRLGFQREDDYGQNCYFYVYTIGEVSLVTQAHDEVENDNWYVDLQDLKIRFTDREDVKEFMRLLKKNNIAPRKPLSPIDFIITKIENKYENK